MLRWIKTFALLELLAGLWLTLKVMFRRKPTIRYPEEKTPLSPRFRGLHALMSDEAGVQKCIGCKLCEVACPAQAIEIDIAEREDGRRAIRYDIDQSKCIFCGYCEQACPVDAIVHTQLFEYVVENKQDLQLNQETLLAIGQTFKDKIEDAKKRDQKYR